MFGTHKITRVVDGVKKEIEEQTPQLKQIYVTDEAGNPAFNDDGTRMFEFAPVMETVFEAYEDPDAPIYMGADIGCR